MGGGDMVEYVYNPKLDGPAQWGWDEDGHLLTTCPDCGKWQILVNKSAGGHDITTTGHVIESIICAYSCGFHKHGKLNDWRDQ